MAVTNDEVIEDIGYAFSPLECMPGWKAASPKDLFGYVKNQDVKSATKALVHGTTPDFKDPATGNTPLHEAVLVKSEVLVKLLIVFDADLKSRNNDKQTALDVAESKGYHDIAKVIKDIIDAEKELENDQPKAPKPPQQAEAGAEEECFMLSLDGGGIRGLVFVQVLIEMKKRKKKLYPNVKESLLSKFNWITGNSTGGIAALAFAASGETVWQGRAAYFRLKDEVLGSDPPIPNEKVDKVFKGLYGKSAKMTHIKGVNVAIMTTLATENPPILHIISNYGPARNKRDPPNEQLVWKAARATSSVPLIFHPQDDVYLDGGLIANNPTTDAIVDFFEHFSNHKLKVVLSLGCGFDKPTAVGHDDIDYHSSKLAKVAECLSPHKYEKSAEEATLLLTDHKTTIQLLKMMLSQITQPNGEVLKRAEFVTKMLGTQYFRINPPLDPSVDFLTTDDAILINMLYQVKYYMLKKCREIIDPVLESLYGQ